MWWPADSSVFTHVFQLIIYKKNILVGSFRGLATFGTLYAVFNIWNCIWYHVFCAICISGV